MRKKTIAIFFIIGVIVAIIGGIVYGVGIASAVSALSANPDSTSAGAGLVGTALLGAAILGIGGIISTIGWIGALIATAKQGRWGWFVAVFLLTGLGELIYLIAGPGL